MPTDPRGYLPEELRAEPALNLLIHVRTELRECVEALTSGFGQHLAIKHKDERDQVIWRLRKAGEVAEAVQRMVKADDDTHRALFIGEPSS